MRKMLKKNDCKGGQKSAGAIGLQREKVEEHLPLMENQQGLQMTFYDWKLVQTWVMTLKFTHKKSRMYVPACPYSRILCSASSTRRRLGGYLEK